MTQIARQPGLVYERTDEGDVAPPVSKYARARALAAQAPAAPSKYAAARQLAAQSMPSSPGVAATITQPGGMPSTTASQLQRPGSLENLGETVGDFAQAGADFVQSAPYGMMKDTYDQAAGLAARVANVPMVGRAMEAVGLRPNLANDTSGYEPDVQPPDSVAGQLGRGVGSVGTAFAATALSGGAPLVLPLVAGAQSLGATYQAARQRALEMGANDQQAHQIASAEADTMGLVSSVTSLPVGQALRGIAPQALMRAVATANRGGQLGQLVRVAAAEGSQEAAEEAAQMVLQRVAEDDPEAFRDWQKRIAMSAGAGALGGTLMAGVQAVGSQQGQRQAPQDYPAQRGALASFSPQNAQAYAQPIPRGEQAGPEASVESVEQGWPSDLTGVQAWDKTAEETARENELKARAMRGEPDRPEDQAFRDQLQSRLQALVGATPQQAAKMSHGDWQKWANARRNGTPDQAMDIVAAAMLRGDDIAVSAMKNEMADKLLGEPNEDATPSERAKFQKNQDDWRATLEAVEEVEKQYKAKDKPTTSNLSSLTLAELRSLDLQRGGTGKGTKAAVLKRLSSTNTETTPATSPRDPGAEPFDRPQTASSESAARTSPEVYPRQAVSPRESVDAPASPSPTSSQSAGSVREPWEPADSGVSFHENMTKGIALTVDRAVVVWKDGIPAGGNTRKDAGKALAESGQDVVYAQFRGEWKRGANTPMTRINEVAARAGYSVSKVVPQVEQGNVFTDSYVVVLKKTKPEETTFQGQKQPWQLSASEYVESTKGERLAPMRASQGNGQRGVVPTVASAMSEHRAIVEKAIAEGKIDSHPDYPDLQPKAPDAETKANTKAKAPVESKGPETIKAPDVGRFDGATAPDVKVGQTWIDPAGGKVVVYDVRGDKVDVRGTGGKLGGTLNVLQFKDFTLEQPLAPDVGRAGSPPDGGEAKGTTTSLADAKRTRAANAVQFTKPIKGPTGATLEGYQWTWKYEEVIGRDGDPKQKRVSDWEESTENAATGRQIVHWFSIKRPDGSRDVVSLETALKEMGFDITPGSGREVKNIAASVKTLARRKMQLAAAEQELGDTPKIVEEARQARLNPADVKVEVVPLRYPTDGEKQRGTKQVVFSADGVDIRGKNIEPGDPVPSKPDANQLETLQSEWREARAVKAGAIPWGKRTGLMGKVAEHKKAIARLEAKIGAADAAPFAKTETAKTATEAKRGVEAPAGVSEGKAPKDLAALKAKYPAVDFKFIKGVITPGAAYMTPKALAEWRNTAKSKNLKFKDQIAPLDAILARQSGAKTQAAPEQSAAEKAMRDGTKKGWTMRDVQAEIRRMWDEKGLDAQEEADAIEETGDPDSFTFGGKVPADLLERLDEEAARRLVRGNVKGGRGEETLARLGADGMADKIREAYQGKFRTAEQKLRKFVGKDGENDPAAALMLAIYDKWPAKDSEVPMTTLDPKKVTAGTTFTINGVEVEIRPHADGGYLVLKDGEDYPITPVDALSAIPADKGSVKQDGSTAPVGEKKTYTSEKLSGERVQNLAGEDVPLTTGRAKSLFGAPVPKAEGDGNGWRLDDRITIGEAHSKDKPSQGRWKVVGIEGSGPDARITMEKVGGTRRQTLPAYGLEGWGIKPMTADERLNAADSTAFDAMTPEEKAAKYPGIQRGESLDAYNRRSGKNDTPEMFGGASDDVLRDDGGDPIPFSGVRTLDTSDAKWKRSTAGRIEPDPIRGFSPKNLTDIRLDLSKWFGVNLRTAKTRRGVAGTYDPKSTSTIIKFSGDLDVGAHELGHNLDDKFGLVKDWAKKRARSPFDAELMPHFSQFGSTTQSGARSNLSYQRTEGVAEWIRAYVMNPEAAKKAAPKFAAHFEAKIPADVRAALDNFGTEIRKWYGANPVEQALANVRMKYKTPSFWEKFKGSREGVFRQNFGQRLWTQLADDLNPIWSAISAARELKGIDLKTIRPSRDAKTMMRLWAGADRKIVDVMQNGPINFNGKRVDGMGGVDWLLEPVRKPDMTREQAAKEMGKVASYAISKRVIDRADKMQTAAMQLRTLAEEESDLRAELAKHGDGIMGSTVDRLEEVRKQMKRLREGPLMGYSGPARAAPSWAVSKSQRLAGIGAGIRSDVTVAQNVVDEIESGPRAKDIQEAASRLTKWNERMVRYAEQAGRLTSEQADAILASDDAYVSFQRVADPDQEAIADLFGSAAAGTARRLASTKDVSKRIKGSTREIENPYVSLLTNTHRIIKEADRNYAMTQLVREFRSIRDMHDPASPPIDLAQFMREAKAGDKDTTKVFVKGVEKHYQFAPEIHAAMRKWGEESFTPTLLKPMRFAASLLRNLVTSAPDFMIRNMIRDPIARGVLSRSGSTPAAQFQYLLKPGEFSKDLATLRRYGGGLFGNWNPSPEYTHQFVADKMAELASDGKTIVTTLRKVRDGASSFFEASESIGRLAEFTKAKQYATEKLGYTDFDANLYAAFQARDLLDYAKAGTLIRPFAPYIPFLNAGIQGTARTAQGVAENPKTVLAKWAAYVVLPSIAAYVFNAMGDDLDEYRQLPGWRRDLFWNFKVGSDTWLSIPKPFEMGVLASGAERAIDKMNGNPNAFDDYGKSVVKGLVPIDESALALGTGPLVEQLTNYDFFRNQSIVPPWEERLAMPLRDGTDRASRVGKLVQDSIGLDARRVDHLAMSLFGGVGKIGLKASDIGRDDKPGAARQLGMSMSGILRGGPGASGIDTRKALDLMQERGLGGTAEYKGLTSLIRELSLAKTAAERDAASEKLRDASAAIRKKYEGSPIVKKEGRSPPPKKRPSFSDR